MARRRAVLLLDPQRRQEQLAYLRGRVRDAYQVGDLVGATVDEEQVARLAGQGIWVQLDAAVGTVLLPAVAFDPAAGEPQPPAGLAAPPLDGDAVAYHLVQLAWPADPSWLDEVE
jgi:hypothetical protein